MMIHYGLARFLIFAIYVLFFSLNFTLIVYSWQNYYASTSGMLDLLKELVGLYSIQFSVILAGIFAMREDHKNAPASYPFFASLLLVLLWNINTSWPLLYLFFTAGPQSMNLDWSLDYWKSVPQMTGFLCTSALTFFFLKSDQAAMPVDTGGDSNGE